MRLGVCNLSVLVLVLVLDAHTEGTVKGTTEDASFIGDSIDDVWLDGIQHPIYSCSSFSESPHIDRATPYQKLSQNVLGRGSIIFVDLLKQKLSSFIRMHLHLMLGILQTKYDLSYYDY